MTPDAPHPPHVTHAHAPHIHPSPEPDVAYIHPDVLEGEERRAAERRKLALKHPAWGMVIFFVAMLPSAYMNYGVSSKIGWWVILPPVFVVLFMGPALIIVGELLLITLVGGIAKLIFPVRSKSMNDWLDAAWDFYPKKGAVVGALAGVFIYFIKLIFL